MYILFILVKKIIFTTLKLSPHIIYEAKNLLTLKITISFKMKLKSYVENKNGINQLTIHKQTLKLNHIFVEKKNNKHIYVRLMYTTIHKKENIFKTINKSSSSRVVSNTSCHLSTQGSIPCIDNYNF